MANSIRAPRNNIVADLRGSGTHQVQYPLSTGGSFDYFQGDLLYWDATAAYVKPLDSDAHASHLVGVALNSAYIAPYASMQQSGGPALVKTYELAALVGFGLVATFYSTSGDTYHDNDVVYFAAVLNDPQTITNTAGTNTHSVGVVKLAPGASAITGGATVLVPVLVIPQFPVQSL